MLVVPKEKPYLFVAGFDNSTIEFGIAPIVSTSTRPLKDLAKKFFEAIDGYHDELQMEWRFGKAKAQKLQWTVGKNGVFLYMKPEDEHGESQILTLLEESDRFAIRGTQGDTEGIVFDLVDSASSIEDFKKRLELSSKQSEELNKAPETDSNGGKS